MPLHLPRLQRRKLAVQELSYGSLLVSTNDRTDEPEALVARLAVVVARHARRPRAAHRRHRRARREPGAVAGLVVVAEVPALAAQEAEVLAPVGQVLQTSHWQNYEAKWLLDIHNFYKLH